VGGRTLSRYISRPGVPFVAGPNRGGFVAPGQRPPAMEITLPPKGRGASVEFLAPESGRYGLNASGESAASLEALSRQAGMKSKGKRFAVYDKTGAKRPLIGPDAADYNALPGETFGVEGPQGFKKLTDRGGRYPGRALGASDAGYIDMGALRLGTPEVAKKASSYLERFAYGSMLSGTSTIAKGHLGPASVLLFRAAEEALALRPGVAGNILKNAFGKPARAAYGRALREGSPDPTATRWGATEGALGLPSRLMAAPDAWATKAMMDAGITLESAKRSAFTGGTRSDVGKFIIDAQKKMPGFTRPIALPFAKTMVNIAERGIERTPGLGLLFEMFQKDPTALRDVLARQGLGLGALAAGWGLSGEKGEMPSPIAMAAAGPYAVPVALGAGARGFMARRPSRTGTTSQATRALRDFTQTVLSQGPLPTEGYQLDRLMDPRMWPTRWVPRALSQFSNAGEYAQPGVFDPMLARIPFLNEYFLNPKRLNRRPR